MRIRDPQESPKNAEQKAITHTQRTGRRPVQALCLLPQTLSSYELHSLHSGRLSLSCNPSLSINISLQRWPAMTLNPLILSLSEQKALRLYTHTAVAREASPMAVSLQNSRVELSCLLHILRHTSLRVKRHSMCPYLLFAVNRGRTKQFTESMFVVALHWNGARILENKYPAKQTRHLHDAGLLQTRSFETQTSILPKT